MTSNRTIADLAQAAQRQDWATVARHASTLAASSPNGEGFKVEGPDTIFARLPPVDWLIEPLDICPGAPTLVAGYGFSGKTVAVQSLALRLAAGGGMIWGMYPAPVAPVATVHLDWEQGPRLTRWRYQRLALGMGIDVAALGDRLGLVSLADRYLDNPSSESALRRAVEGRRLAIVDSFRAACPSVDENASDARAPLDMMGKVSEATGCCFVVLHHARKPNKENVGGAKYTIRGSGAFFDGCQSVLVFGKEDKNAPVLVQHEKARVSGRPAEDFCLTVEDVPNGGLTVTGRGVIVETKEEKDAKKLTAGKDAIKAYLTRVGNARSSDELRAGAGLGQGALLVALRDLLTSGEVINSGTSRSPCYHVGIK